MVPFVSITAIVGWVLVVTKRQALGGALIFLANGFDAVREILLDRWGWLAFSVFFCAVAVGVIADALRRPEGGATPQKEGPE